MRGRKEIERDETMESVGYAPIEMMEEVHLLGMKKSRVG